MHGPDSEKAAEERLERLFKKLDTRGEGRLDHDALREGLTRINHPLKDADLREILDAVDTSRDGFIQFSEFKLFFKGAEQELWRIFKSVDLDGNGKIDRKELQHALSQAGIVVDPPERLEEFFRSIDRNRDGEISFEEWRDFLLFMPQEASIRTIYSYYLSTVNVNPEGDVNLNDELNLQGLGTAVTFPFKLVLSMQKIADIIQMDPRFSFTFSGWPILSWSWPGLGYFLAGGVAGALSRTATAPLDRIKVFLIAQSGSSATSTASNGSSEAAVKRTARPLKDAIVTIWRSGGFRAFFAGNGLNVIKVLPESAIKFGSFEAAKRAMACLEGVEDVSQISPLSRFVAGGVGGVVSQFAVYPIDTLKFRLQCEMVENGSRGTKLITEVAQKTWKNGGVCSFYRGLPLALVGIFPYSAIDLGTFEYLKRAYVKKHAKRVGCREEDVRLPVWTTLGIGAVSGSVGASMVYPINLLRTRLQAQGTSHHPQTYTGMWDVTMKTYKAEGIRGMYRGLVPNMMKVIPAVSISYVVYEQLKSAMRLK